MNNSSRMTIVALCGLLLCAAAASAQPGRGMRSGHGGPGHAWDGFSTRHDLDGDGGVTADEFAASDSRFESLDRNGDGIITQDDFAEIRAAASESFAGAFVSRLADTDRDHAVTADEWQAFLAAVDTDGDGLFATTDVVALFPGRPGGESKLGGPRGGRRFDAGTEGTEGETDRPSREDRLTGVLDEDADGLLEIGDLEAIFFDLDQNSDGALSGDELPGPRFGPPGRRGGGRRFGPGTRGQ